MLLHSFNRVYLFRATPSHKFLATLGTLSYLFRILKHIAANIPTIANKNSNPGIGKGERTGEGVIATYSRGPIQSSGSNSLRYIPRRKYCSATQLRIRSTAKSIAACRMHLQKKLHGGLRGEKRGCT